jgi:hypothetical protein
VLILTPGYQLNMGAALDLLGGGGSFVKRQPEHLLTRLLLVTDLTYSGDNNKTQFTCSFFNLIA